MYSTHLSCKNVRRALARLVGYQTGDMRDRLRQLSSSVGNLEQLEARELMAVLDSTNGRLTIQGTSASDNIRLSLTSGFISVIKNGLTDPVIVGSSSSASVSATLVRNIVINGGLGNDRLDASAVSIPTTLSG